MTDEEKKAKIVQEYICETLRQINQYSDKFNPDLEKLIDCLASQKCIIPMDGYVEGLNINDVYKALEHRFLAISLRALSKAYPNDKRRAIATLAIDGFSVSKKAIEFLAQNVSSTIDLYEFADNAHMAALQYLNISELENKTPKFCEELENRYINLHAKIMEDIPLNNRKKIRK